MSTSVAQQERRKYPRISANFSLEVSPSEVGVGEGMNVSQGGVQFSHEGKLELGQVVSLTMRVNGFSGVVSVRGKVLRCDLSSGNTYNISVNFIGVDNETEKSILDMINSF